MKRKLWKKNYGRKIMAGLLACALIFSCLGVRTTKAASWMPNVTASSALKDKKKILLIGNSMTFYNNTPFLLRKMVGSNVVVNYLTWGGQSLYNHGEWINKVLKSGGSYNIFKNSLTAQDKVALFKEGSGSSASYDETKAKNRYDWYASALFQDYTKANTKTLTKISYDYVVLQDRTANLENIENANSYIKDSKQQLSRDFYKTTWMGGLCRNIYELRSNGAVHGRTKYIINATYTSVENKILSAAETLQTKIDNKAVILNNILANGFRAPGNKTYTLGSADVKVAYTGDVVLSYLHNTKGSNIPCTVSNISTMIRSDFKHPKYAASIMQAATINKVIFSKLPSYLTLTSANPVSPAFNLSSCSADTHVPTSTEYTFVKNNNATLYQYVQNYGTTTKAAWK
ncbi:MAG: hypothetical protein HFG31_04395 [Eubacterium sp.]|nr:hypothetical protein [Eubacterium sp.]